jgi:hypothetical protein
LLKGYFPAQWKVKQVIILKPGKPPNELTSYLLISLLPVVSKVCEKLLLKYLLKRKWLKIMDLYYTISSASDRGAPQ